MKIEDVIATAVRVGESVKDAKRAVTLIDPGNLGWFEAMRFISAQVWEHLPPRVYLATNWRRADNHETLTGDEPPGIPVVMELRLDTGRHTGLLTFYGKDVIDAYLDMAEFLGIKIKVPSFRCECGVTFRGIRQHCEKCRKEIVTT